MRTKRIKPAVRHLRRDQWAITYVKVPEKMKQLLSSKICKTFTEICKRNKNRQKETQGFLPILLFLIFHLYNNIIKGAKLKRFIEVLFHIISQVGNGPTLHGLGPQKVLEGARQASV